MRNVIKTVSYLISFSSSFSAHSTTAPSTQSSFFVFVLRFLCDSMLPVKFFITFFFSLYSFLHSVCSRFVSFIRILPSSRFVDRRIACATAMNSRQIWQNWDVQTDILLEYMYFFFDYLRRLVFHVPTVTLHSSPSAAIRCRPRKLRTVCVCAEKSTQSVAKHSRFRVHTRSEQRPPPPTLPLS